MYDIEKIQGQFEGKKGKSKPLHFGHEKVNNDRPENPFRNINDQIEKVDITKGFNYQSASLADVFQLRMMEREELASKNINPFLVKKRELEFDYDPDYEQEALVKFRFRPYQQKYIY